MDYTVEHGYKNGQTLSCTLCQTTLKVALEKPNVITIGDPGSLGGKAFICRDCGKIFCLDCLVGSGGYGQHSCDACGGPIDIPRGKPGESWLRRLFTRLFRSTPRAPEPVQILDEGIGKVQLGEDCVYTQSGTEQDLLDAWNRVSLGEEADKLVNSLLEIAQTQGLLNKRVEVRQIGERLYEIGKGTLMKKVWWRVEAEKYRTGLRVSRELDLCWDGIGGSGWYWMG